MSEQVVYTTSRLGALLLYSMVLSVILITIGLLGGLQGVAAGGLVIFGAVLMVAHLAKDLL